MRLKGSCCPFSGCLQILSWPIYKSTYSLLFLQLVIQNYPCSHKCELREGSWVVGTMTSGLLSHATCLCPLVLFMLSLVHTISILWRILIRPVQYYVLMGLRMGSSRSLVTWVSYVRHSVSTSAQEHTSFLGFVFLFFFKKAWPCSWTSRAYVVILPMGLATNLAQRIFLPLPPTTPRDSLSHVTQTGGLLTLQSGLVAEPFPTLQLSNLVVVHYTQSTGHTSIASCRTLCL